MHWKLTILEKVKQIPMFSLTPRSAKTWDIFPKWCGPFRSVFLQGTFCSQPEVSTTFIEKVMTHYVFFFIFTKVVTLTLNFTRYKKVNMLQGPMNWIYRLPQESGRSDQRCDLWTLLRRTNGKNIHAETQTRKPWWPIYFAKIEDFAK